MLFTSKTRKVFTVIPKNWVECFWSHQKLFNTVNQALSVHKSENYYFFPTKDESSGVQKIEGPLWKVPRCWSVFFSALNMPGNVLLDSTFDGIDFFPVAQHTISSLLYTKSPFRSFIPYYSVFCNSCLKALSVKSFVYLEYCEKWYLTLCLWQSSRFLGWRSHWVVIEDGTLSWYPRQWDNFICMQLSEAIKYSMYIYSIFCILYAVVGMIEVSVLLLHPQACGENWNWWL